jgi:hypothetical protein
MGKPNRPKHGICVGTVPWQCDSCFTIERTRRLSIGTEHLERTGVTSSRTTEGGVKFPAEPPDTASAQERASFQRLFLILNPIQPSQPLIPVLTKRRTLQDAPKTGVLSWKLKLFQGNRRFTYIWGPRPSVQQAQGYSSPTFPDASLSVFACVCGVYLPAAFRGSNGTA